VGNKKITVVRLLASIPVGLSPYILECIVFKFESPYLASSVLASIIPFLFVARKRAFLFCSVISLLIMCMTYQAASGIYPIIVVILCFLDWNTRKKTNKEILSFLAISALAYCFAILFYRFFLMRSYNVYVSTAMHPLSHIILGTLSNIKNYAMTINSDLGLIWKVGTVLVLFFFIVKSTHQSMRKKIYSFFVSVLIVGISFILSFGVYSLLEIPLFAPRALLGFGAFLAILCIYVVSNYKKIAIVTVLALNWCLFVFAFSYGNALADQARYAEFRIGILLHDLSALYPNRSKDTMMMVQLKNSIDYAPSIKNIAKHYPIIEKMVPKRLGATGNDGDYDYFLSHFNYNSIKTEYNYSAIDFSTLNLPVVLDSYYHTIQSDGDRILIVLKH